MSEKRDIHNVSKGYKTAIESSKKHLSPANYKLVMSFLEDCRIGKTGKKIKPNRLWRYLSDLKRLALYFKNKPFRRINEDEFKQFYIDLENDKFRQKNGKPYSRNTKIEFVKTLNKFFRWAYNDAQKLQSHVGWMKKDFGTREDPTPALSREEAERLADACKMPHKAMVWFLFDSGARAEEFLNVRMKHLIKTPDGYYKVRIEHSKTLPRTISLRLASQYVDEWVRNHPDKNDLEAFLVPMKYDSLRLFLNRLGKKILNKRVHPHLLRHSSVTYYARKLRNPYKLNYRYGWATASDMAQQYIDREGLVEEETAEIIKSDEITTLKKEIQRLKEETDMRRQADKIMSALLQDSEIQKVLEKRLKEKKLLKKIKLAL